MIVTAEIRIRRAIESDLETLKKFQAGIVAAERPFDPTIRKGEVSYYDLAALIGATDAFVAIAEANGATIGCGFARRAAARSFIEPPFHAYVGLMFVEPAFRGAGVSALILNRLKEWARSEGLSEIHLEVYPDNEAAVRAYKKAGFAPYMLEMRLPLDDEGA